MEKKNGIATRLLAGTMALALLAATAGQASRYDAPNAGVAVQSEVVQSGGQTAEAITGAGPWWAKMTCIGCGAAFLAAGGGAAVAVAVALVVGWGVTWWCYKACAHGFDWGD